MIARLWRGWAAADSADEVEAHLRDVTLARYAHDPGNHSVHMFRRPSAAGLRNAGSGGRSRDRTCDHLVVSEVLYR